MTNNMINTLWPSDAMWLYRTGSILAQLMAWCLQAASHYLIQCWPRSMVPYDVNRPQCIKSTYRWLIARLCCLQCVSNGDTVVLPWAIDIIMSHLFYRFLSTLRIMATSLSSLWETYGYSLKNSGNFRSLLFLQNSPVSRSYGGICSSY